MVKIKVGNKGNIRTDCFSYRERDGKCAYIKPDATGKPQCYFGRCAFYKTCEQHEADKLKYPYNAKGDA